MAFKTFLCVVAAYLLAACGTSRSPAVASTALREFDQRLDEYMKLRKAAAAAVPSLERGKSAEGIAARQTQLAETIRQARPSAKQGDLFIPEVAAEFRNKIGLVMRGPQQERIRQTLNNAEPVRLPLRVNDVYPADVPLQSVPPTLLASLPKLPSDLRYGIVDHDLLLQDVGANLVVDFIPHALP